MKSSRMFWQIVDKIETLIDSGEFPPGSRLPPERKLAELFDVSRPTIREAIIALEVRRRVEVKTSSGVYVLQNPQIEESDIRVSAFELTQARALVEGEAAALAAVSITEAELKKLEATLIAMEKGIDAENADREFHFIISKATRNNAVLLAVERFWQLRDSQPDIINAYKNVCDGSNSDRSEEHRNIYLALSKRDSAEARAAMHLHFNRLINNLFEISEARALEEVRKKSNQTRDLYSLNHLVS
ncbi:FadR/GntR family transcriptional regulator [Glaciecola petra]|uniref:FadR/GntR family transcriptional regulator n=1 Tax=Glaciecola petra TaxID=3075602 RepID=A0ABU2ZTG0_9ALTE|nr:FadR/GntR family transcriptional regulator [Aestuariibacter sp. P117]MDT0595700.1 FadR/GntR family transcriptional regulator [Aestuariibacter sp. P117]